MAIEGMEKEEFVHNCGKVLVTSTDSRQQSVQQRMKAHHLGEPKKQSELNTQGKWQEMKTDNTHCCKLSIDDQGQEQKQEVTKELPMFSGWAWISQRLFIQVVTIFQTPKERRQNHSRGILSLL